MHSRSVLERNPNYRCFLREPVLDQVRGRISPSTNYRTHRIAFGFNFTRFTAFMAPARDDEFLPEVWGLYSLSTVWLVLRYVVRIRVDGIKGLRLDDALACVVLFAWTYTCAVIQITYYTGTSLDFTPKEVATFDQKRFAEVEYGSKLFLGSWYA